MPHSTEELRTNLDDIIESKTATINKQFLLLDHQDNTVDDITDRVTACTIQHGNFRNIHRTIEVDIIGELKWGYHRIKPYVQLDTPHGISDWYPLGVFHLTAPEYELGRYPSIYHVGGFDKLYALDQLLANSFTAEVGASIIDLAQLILFERGFDNHQISLAAGHELITTPRSWSIIEDTTELSVINTLLGMVNYRGLYMTNDGHAKSDYYLPPDRQQVTWHYTPLVATTNVLPQRIKTNDFTSIPNRFIFWRASIAEETLPSIGDGLYIYDNINEGLSSQIQRGGLVITHKEGLEVVSQAELETAGQRIINEMLQSQVTIRLSTTLNPLHGHFDIVSYNDPDGGIYGLFQHLTWDMNLFAGRMEHEFRSVSVV